MSEGNEKNPIIGMMDETIGNIRNIVDVNTVVGEPITTKDGTVILPISKASFGFASGGSDFSTKNDGKGFAGGGGAGVSIVPIAFLVISSTGHVSLQSVGQAGNAGPAEKIIDMIPGIVDMIKPKKKDITNEVQESESDD